MKRRTFLKHTGHAIGIPALLGSFSFSSYAQSLAKAATENNKVLVLIYLQGGNDGLNTVIPLDQLSALNQTRSNIVLPDNKLLPLTNTDVALHPSLSGLRSLFEEDRLRVIQSVGYPEQNFSHFRSIDIWMTGADAEEYYTSGWTGRYLDYEYPGYPEGFPNEQCPDPISIEIRGGSSLLFQGLSGSMSLMINNPTSFYSLIDKVQVDFPNTNTGDKLEYIYRVAEQSQVYGEVVKKAAQKVQQQTEYPETNLGKDLKIVSQLIAGGLTTPLYLVKINGFDTHSSQVLDSDHTQGKHATLLSELNDAIMAFMKDLEYQGTDDKVIGMTFSEFGRRVVSNASQGTDHGAAAPMFIFGNEVAPGVLGNNPEIPSDATSKFNLPWQYDFRQIYSSILEQWFGLNSSTTNSIMLNDFTTVPIIKSTSTLSEGRKILAKNITVYPNPVREITNISFTSYEKYIQIDVVSISGKKIGRIYAGNSPAGKQTLTWNARRLAPGNYFVVFTNGHSRETVQIIKQ